ncbi:glycosyltransferase family 4 protein [Falsirhodobacter deserti]|uniref:glycosyltransferase family 4 protein n=1 Tax=Falsirhodobacter deserti TaxID=1365611 RepID=UPI001F4EC6C4|nr:glycosyltransferase family 4 protein [Falsirhodobacter deserti]
MTVPSFSGPIAYLTGEYPKVSHTFIQREIEMLEAAGHTILRCSVRQAPAKDVVADQQAEAARTFFVLKAAKQPATLIRAHLAALRRDRGRWLSALRLAWRTRPPGAKALLWQIFYFLEAAVLTRHLLDRRAVHLHNHFASSSGSVAMLTSEMSGIPFSFTMHGPTEFFEPKWWRLDEKVGRAAFVACISHYCRSQLMFFSDPVHWHRLRIVHCGVRPERYARDIARPADAPARVLFVGRLDSVKGGRLLLEAFGALRERHPDAALEIVGDGPDRAAMEARARELGLGSKVRFHGYRTQEEVARILSGADMLVLPSFAEGVPVVLMEAMASGLPVVSTRIAGIPELVEDGKTGFLVPAGDLETLTARIDTLLSDPQRAQAMGAAGRAVVEAEFNLEREATWLAQIFAGSQAGELPASLRPILPLQDVKPDDTFEGTGAKI